MWPSTSTRSGRQLAAWYLRSSTRHLSSTGGLPTADGAAARAAAATARAVHTTAAAPQRAAAPAAAPQGHGDNSSGGSDLRSDRNPLMARYEALQASGELRPDARQAAVASRLGALLDDIGRYSEEMRRYKQQLDDYKARRRQRLKELEAEDEETLRREHQQQQRQQQDEAAAAAATATAAAAEGGDGPPGSGLTSWLARALGLQKGAASSSAPSPPQQQPPLTPQQRAHLLARRRRERVTKELGTGPAPPPPPRGLYIHGSVGSGKSLLMDMFFDAATRPRGAAARGAGGGFAAEAAGAGLEFARRMHFNAAMLELHSRLHLLDTRREARQRDPQDHHHHARHDAHHGHDAPTPAAAAHAPAAAGEGTAAAAQGVAMGSASAAAAQAKRVPDAVLDRALELGEELESSAASAVQGTATAGLTQSGAPGEAEGGGGPGQPGHETEESEEGLSGGAAFAKWFDGASRRDKAAKAAVLAVRRHIREARAGAASGAPRARLAAANASVMRAAARSLIRSRGPDPSGGWDHGRGHAAALLCFDEVQVTDVWSAVALKALVEALTAEGCVVVATSNRAPHELPRHGLHEAMFSHFIDSLLASCDVLELSAADDYRRATLDGPAARALQQPVSHSYHIPESLTDSSGGSGDSSSTSSGSSGAAGGELALEHAAEAEAAVAAAGGRLYFWPLGAAAERELERLWGQTANTNRGGSGSGGSGGGAAAEASLPGACVPVLFGRQLGVPRAAGGAAWFHFSDLCARPLGAADYLSLGSHFHTVFISGVPAMSMQQRDQARRFITLVDELYNSRTLLVLSAEGPPDALFAGSGAGEEPIVDLEGLQFETAVEGSRLRRDLAADGGVAPVAATEAGARAAAAALGGAEERFAFARAVSRLYEMQSRLYVRARPRCGLEAL